MQMWKQQGKTFLISFQASKKQAHPPIKSKGSQGPRLEKPDGDRYIGWESSQSW